MSLERIITGKVAFWAGNAEFVVRYRAWIDDAGELISCQEDEFVEMGFDPYEDPIRERLYSDSLMEAVNDDVYTQLNPV